MVAYPLIRTDDRSLPPDFEGIVVTCDVDKTYLDTDFESTGGLLTIPFEWAQDKRTVPGMGVVLRALRFGSEPGGELTPFYFVTASPPLLTRVLFRKMLLDGVQCDGITCKDWKRVMLVHRRPDWLKRQLPYKLSALLNQRTCLPCNAREILIGDDVEIDATAYAIYADIVSGRHNEESLCALLGKLDCDKEEIDTIVTAFRMIAPCDEAIRRIYIYLYNKSEPGLFHRFGDDLIACRSAFQLALHLAIDGRVRQRTISETLRVLLERGVKPQDLLAEITDGLKRGLFDAKPLRDSLDEVLKDKLLDLPKKAYELAADEAPPSRKARGGWWLPPET